jgi:hypothetical protein
MERVWAVVGAICRTDESGCKLVRLFRSSLVTSSLCNDTRREVTKSEEQVWLLTAGAVVGRDRGSELLLLLLVVVVVVVVVLGARGSVVAKTLCCKLEGRGFNT